MDVNSSGVGGTRVDLPWPAMSPPMRGADAGQSGAEGVARAVGEGAVNTEVSIFDASDGGAIVHLPLKGRAFRVDDRTGRIIEKIVAGQALPEDDVSARVLAALDKMGIIGGEMAPEPATRPLQEFRPTEATLIFTESCNLGCTYCYASSSPQKSPPMSEEIARAAVDLVLQNASETDENLALIRYIGGGEPTMEWKLLQSVTDYIRSASQAMGVRYRIRLITNGTLLTPDRVAWIRDNIQFVTLSFDILPELQAQRSYADGRSTHGKLVKVIRELVEQGVDFHLRTTVSAQGAARLVDMVKFVHDNTGAASVRFEPMAEIGRSVTQGMAKPLQQEFVESFKAAYKLGRELGIDVTCKMFQNTLRRSSRFCNTEFSVTPEGIVSGCHRYSKEEHDGYDLFRIGRYDGSRFQFDIDRVNALRAIDVHSFSECTSCMARWNCAGGCLSARVSRQGISQSGPLCDLTRDLLKFSIEQKVGGPHG
ncbi:radical SAM protein [Streptomyces sp. NPDC054958]